MITRLTEDQEALLPVYRGKWLKIGLSTETTDRAKAEETCDLAYRCAGLDPPGMKIWFPDPYSGSLAAWFVPRLPDYAYDIGRKIAEYMCDHTMGPINLSNDLYFMNSVLSRGNIGPSFPEAVKPEIGSSVFLTGPITQIDAQVKRRIGDEARTQIRDLVDNPQIAQIRDHVAALIRLSVREEYWDASKRAPFMSFSDGPARRTQPLTGVLDQVKSEVWRHMGGPVSNRIWDVALAAIMSGCESCIRCWKKRHPNVLIDAGRPTVEESLAAAEMGLCKACTEQNVLIEALAPVKPRIRHKILTEIKDYERGRVSFHAMVREPPSFREPDRRVSDDDYRLGLSVVCAADAYGHDEEIVNRFGSHDGDWLGFFDFVATLDPIITQKLAGLSELARHCGWVWPFEHVAILTEKPCKLHLNSQGQLHNDEGMALSYSNGWGGYFLNGVRVPEEIVMIPAEELDPHMIVTERNTEVRREIVRKIGIDRVCYKLKAEVIDKQGDYELLNLRLEHGRDRPYLKILCPSTGVWYVEGVPPGTRTVAEALQWRNRSSVPPANLT